MIDSTDAVPPARPRRLAALPGLAGFAALFVLLLGVVSFQVPIHGTFGPPPGRAPPAAAMAPRCLSLSGFPAKGYRWFPREVRLLPEKFAPSVDWYRVRSRSGGSGFGWRPAGPDSFDITGMHGPRLRLSNRGAPMTGRGGWPGFATVWEALADREWRMQAREIPCPADLLDDPRSR
jgi:hypothetical protein